MVQTVKEILNETSVKVALAAFMFVSLAIIITILFLIENPDYGGILIEGFGFLFDIILFGVILTIYDFIKKKERKQEDELDKRKRTIRDYFNEFEDFRLWGEEEGVLRKAGIIKRLNDLKAKLPPMQGAKLKEAPLVDVKLQNVLLDHADLRGADLRHANLKGARLWKSNLEGAILHAANLEGAFLAGATGLTLEQIKSVIWDDNTNWPSYIKPEELNKLQE